jgi:hypothetical protein
MRPGPLQCLRVALVVTALAVLSLMLASFVRPWMGAGTYPLVVNARLDSGARLEAVLGDGWSAPLVRTDDGFFVTELPPRRAYALSLRASVGPAQVTSVDILDLHVRPVATRFSMNTRVPIAVNAGDTFSVSTLPIAVTSGEFGKAFAAVFVLLSLFTFGIVALFRKRSAPLCDGDGFQLWQWGVVVLLAACHVGLVATSTPVFWPADSIGYAAKALQILQHGGFYTGGIYYEITRAPGAPLIEALGFLLFGISPGAVALLQSILYCLAAVFALNAVARTGSRWVALCAAPFVLVDPAMISICRTFSSEAPFAIVALLFAGCVLRSLQSKGWREWAWIGCAAVAAGYEVMVRPNGVILLAFPLFMVGRLFVTALRGRSLYQAKPVAMWVLISVVSLGALFAWSWRNYRVQGYFAPTDIVGLSAAEACFKSGILDLRSSADDEALYEELVRSRRATNYNFEAWSLAGVYQRRVAEEGPVDKSAVRRVDLLEKAFAERSNLASPWESRAARFARIFRWGVFLDTDPNYQPYGAPSHGFIVYSDEQWNDSNKTIAHWMDERFAVPQKALGWQQRAFNHVMDGCYKWGLIALVLAALAAFALACQRVWLAPLVFLLPYFGNILLNAWLGVVVSRYVYVLEPFLILGIAACLAQWRVSRQ